MSKCSCTWEKCVKAFQWVEQTWLPNEEYTLFGVANFKAHWSVSLSNTKTDKYFVVQQNKCKCRMSQKVSYFQSSANTWIKLKYTNKTPSPEKYTTPSLCNFVMHFVFTQIMLLHYVQLEKVKFIFLNGSLEHMYRFLKIKDSSYLTNIKNHASSLRGRFFCIAQRNGSLINKTYTDCDKIIHTVFVNVVNWRYSLSGLISWIIMQQNIKNFSHQNI